MYATTKQSRPIIQRVIDRAASGESGAARVLWRPHAQNTPQQRAYEIARQGLVDELGYGGQAGGGKTDLALGLAGNLFQRSLILRREFPQLEEVIDRGDDIYPAGFVGGPKQRWRFGNRIVTLRSMQHEKDWRKYKGQSRDFMCFDEAAEFTEKQVRSLTGWTRTSDPHQKTLVLYCFNPPTTPEGEWIVRYFAPWLDPEHPNPAQQGEVRWFARLDDEDTEVESGEPFTYEGETIYPISRTFIPASRHDNPYLGEDYERRLNNLPEPLRSQVKKGDFTIGIQDDPWQIIPTAWVLEAQRRWEQMARPQVSLRAVGVDPAHGGEDRTTISKLYGTWFDELLVYSGVETPRGEDTARYVLAAMERRAPIGVDAIGYGASAHERLEDVERLEVYGINAGAGSDATDKSGIYGFANLRSEMHWRFREALDPESGEDIALPPDRGLRVELCAPRYRLVGGKYKVESKDDIKARLGYSPDLAEAVLLTWHVATLQPKVASNVARKRNPGRSRRRGR